MSLLEKVGEQGAFAIKAEVDRALKQIGDDPSAAAHYAGNILEATFKHYLKESGVTHMESATLAELWPLVRESLGINPKDLESKDLKKISSGLNSIVDGTMHLRNNRSAAHGKSIEASERARLSSRHARLVVNSASTLAEYVMDCLKDRQIGKRAS